MINYILLFILIYILFLHSSIENLIGFLLLVLIFSLNLFNNWYYFLTWIYIIIYGSALVILFSYTLMMKFNYIEYNNFYSLKKLSLLGIWPLIYLSVLILYTTKYLENIFSYTYINYESLYIMIYLTYMEPIFVILVFVQLVYIFYILIL